MSDKFQPGEEMFDEVSGHTLKSHLNDEETEGHMPRIRLAVPEEPSTEGETEGHGALSGRALPKDEDGEEGDGTEGHGVRVRI
jgi:hypothetical protein